MMSGEKIVVTTENGRSVEVELLSRAADAVWVMVGEGPHSVKCKLTPTRNGLAFAGSVMGREIVYARSVRQVQADIAARQRQQDRYRVR